ncbi:MAG: hypothetical protein ACD_19C00167G0004 [uncultured bacterium]|uniref:Type II secretion system protein GspG C-terminal domain-containing protein n=1 Tax=Candidatus Daviesbacteria bacterium RIFCSPHIGHO2_01_FULL_40_11 TaxID=1797762 RepID=A0A1F5JMB0_9BACT|nr:MAG: hypothetical protein ACD_19C00167G0004 [uncultured bacterium]OGE29570.1 MAG: hypothetical protein A2867_00210 [Candidatus Daviesbacteria bacterium RIFCSPHIGHO2_01_FULL_40_11]OGE62581.1 MAG: hypothetical protein A2964_00100 [Candidatus Daviesbacteria bacterium RIFCSPLOWO2_01_FULL_40_27]
MKKFLPTFKDPRGFTLIELMIVITIIGILSLVAVGMYNSVQSKARDSKRRGDIDAISRVLEVNKGATAYQPLAKTQFAGGVVPTDSSDRTPQYCILATNNTIPKPTVWDNTQCPDTFYAISSGQPDNSPTNFQVCALLEIGTNPDNIYCVSSQQ